MTAEEALEIVTNAIQTEHMTAEQDKALAIAQKALEKQIPKKPNVHVKGTTGYNTLAYCPECGDIVGCNKYCSRCGQRLE